MALPLAALFAGFSLVAMSLQVGHYRPLLVLPLGLAAGVAAWAVGLTRPEPLAGRALDGGAAARRRVRPAERSLLRPDHRRVPRPGRVRDHRRVAHPHELLRVIISVAPSAVQCLVARAC